SQPGRGAMTDSVSKITKTIVDNGRPKGDKYYNKTAVNYEKRRQKQDWWHVEQKEMAALLDTLPDNLTVVDIPFGTGRFVTNYHEHGHKVSGLDASSHMIKTAREILGDSFIGVNAITGDAANLPYKANEFDLLVSTRFLRDIVTFKVTKEVLSEFARVTKKYAIIQMGQNLSDGAAPDENGTMGGTLSEGEVDALLLDHGFKVLDKRLVHTLPDDNSEIFHILCEKVASD
ncbi:MAG: methyltransferase domain-containing protein, partial [Marinosulfonomonas sp.]|nr:methyltransferase domain-containing protein [Marinosulfonomonas sp.]